MSDKQRWEAKLQLVEDQLACWLGKLQNISEEKTELERFSDAFFAAHRRPPLQHRVEKALGITLLFVMPLARGVMLILAMLAWLQVCVVLPFRAATAVGPGWASIAIMLLTLGGGVGFYIWLRGAPRVIDSRIIRVLQRGHCSWRDLSDAHPRDLLTGMMLHFWVESDRAEKRPVVDRVRRGARETLRMLASKSIAKQTDDHDR